MVVASDGPYVLSQACWGDSTMYLRDLLAKKGLPQVVRIVKGQYMGLGVPSLPSPTLSQGVLLTSVGHRRYIAAQCVKFREKHRQNLIGPKLAIPETFDGYFEILNEDGHAVRCIESVAELSRRYPHSCLVRDNVKAFFDPKWSEKDPVLFSLDQTRVIYSGEVLTLKGEITGPARTSRHEAARYLRCSDSRGGNVFLPLELRGKFSAIAREDNISGVHTVQTLLSKRLPLMVRLVHGRPPVTSGFKNVLQNFSTEMRLFAVTKEECILGLPLSREGSLVILPPSLPLKLQSAANSSVLQQLKEFSRVEEKTSVLYDQIKDRIQVLDDSSVKKPRSESSQWRFPPLLKRSSTEIQILRHSHSPQSPVASTLSIEEEPCQQEYEDIDQIYDYVRGFAPLPRHIKSPYDWSDSHSAEIYQRQQTADFRTRRSPTVHNPLEKVRQRNDLEHPDPPPSSYRTPDYELKRSAEKRTRRALDREPARAKDYSRQISGKAVISEDLGSTLSLSKIYVKASNKRNGVSRLLRPKASYPLKENVYISQPIGGAHMAASPLFRIRYKSLTNLLQAVDSDTLNSSNSGGNGSKTSGGLPEKRIRRLSRPRSLTDLVWDLKNQHVHQAPSLEVHEHEPVIADMPPRFSPAPLPTLSPPSPNGKTKGRSYLALLSPGNRISGGYDFKKNKLIHSNSAKPSLAYI